MALKGGVARMPTRLGASSGTEAGERSETRGGGPKASIRSAGWHDGKAMLIHEPWMRIGAISEQPDPTCDFVQ